MTEEQVKALLEEKATEAKGERVATGTRFAACGAILNVKGDRCDNVAIVAVWQETEKWARITRGCGVHATAYKNVKAALTHNPITVKGGAR